MDAEAFSFRKEGRDQLTALVVAGVWLALVAAIVLVDAALWLMAAIGTFTLPALWDLLKNPQSGLAFTPDALTWFSGRRAGCIQWDEIARVQLDTRLDFSVRASAVLHTGRKIRLPYECTPPHQIFEAALNARGIRTERHHFSLIG
ncbi:MAG: hypothetical protein AB8B62_10785 [Roseobacter sp.]